jgi:hypothetical protein
MLRYIGIHVMHKACTLNHDSTAYEYICCQQGKTLFSKERDAMSPGGPSYLPQLPVADLVQIFQIVLGLRFKSSLEGKVVSALNLLSPLPWRYMSGGIAPPFLTLALDRCYGQLHVPAALHSGMSPRSWGCGEKKSFLLSEIEHRPSSPQSAAIPAELFRLQKFLWRWYTNNFFLSFSIVLFCVQTNVWETRFCLRPPYFYLSKAECNARNLVLNKNRAMDDVKEADNCSLRLIYTEWLKSLRP